MFRLHRENSDESTQFSSLTKLVKHHARKLNIRKGMQQATAGFKDGMTQLLAYSVKKNLQMDPWNFGQEEVEMTGSQLGEGQFGEVRTIC